MQGSLTTLHEWEEGNQSPALLPHCCKQARMKAAACRSATEEASLSRKLDCRVVHSRIEDTLSNGFRQVPVQKKMPLMLDSVRFLQHPKKAFPEMPKLIRTHSHLCANN